MEILIKKSRDPLMWYSEKVGQKVPYLREEDNIYWSREEAGFKNIVYKEDAELILSDNQLQQAS